MSYVSVASTIVEEVCVARLVEIMKSRAAVQAICIQQRLKKFNWFAPAYTYQTAYSSLENDTDDYEYHVSKWLYEDEAAMCNRLIYLSRLSDTVFVTDDIVHLFKHISLRSSIKDRL